MWPFRGISRKPVASGQTVEVRAVFSDELLGGPDPPGDDDDLEDISAGQAAQLLRQGRKLSRKRVHGDLVLGQQDVGGPLDLTLDDGHKLALAGLAFPPVVTVPFRQAVEIEECLFEGEVRFSGLSFDEQVSICSARFLGDVDFGFCAFNKAVALPRCQFDEKCKFGDTTFGDSAHFDRSRFEGPADFFNAVFQKGASFANARFRDEVNLSHTRFVNPRSVFPCLDFRNCVCREAAFFHDAQFEGIADFTSARFLRVAEFSGARFRLIALTDAEFARLNLRWEQIAGEKLLIGRMMFQNFDPTREVIREEEFAELLAQREDPPLAEKHRQYDVLKAVFTRQGDHVSADGCFYEWKQLERCQSVLNWRPETWLIKAFHYLNWLTCGYGTKPIRAVLFALIAIVLFGFGYWVLDAAPGQTAASVVSLDTLLGKLEFSFSTFMSIGSSGSGLRPAVRMLFLCERLLGWLTLLLFVTTYTRIMLR
jgi:uncharacterized protein YjbI with pentapeptide repeats